MSSKKYLIYRVQLLTIVILSISIFYSCQKFLAAKPQITLEVPSSVQDLQAIIDNDKVMNVSTCPSVLETASDDYYISYNAWLAAGNIDDRTNYIWDPNATYYNNWSIPYEEVFYANEVLDVLPQLGHDTANSTVFSNLKGAALFFRSYSFFHIAQLYAKAYDSATANMDLGIPLRLSSDVNVATKRATVQQTYSQIINDLLQAAKLLSTTSLFPTRPTKAAAYGELSRVFLAMGNYTDAGLYADSCLQLYNTLIDYNTLDASSSVPIPRFNSEVMFHSSAPAGIYAMPTGMVDSGLYNRYVPNDLRRSIFFRDNGDGSFSFKGNYHGKTTPFFDGIATDEIYLNRAECYARQGKTSQAMNDLNTLLQARWKNASFVPLSAPDADSALRIILAERRKELLFRGIRWTDLKRLNKDPRFAQTLVRNLNGQSYSLPPNDNRYELLIPFQVIATTGIQQNPR